MIKFGNKRKYEINKLVGRGIINHAFIQSRRMGTTVDLQTETQFIQIAYLDKSGKVRFKIVDKSTLV